jgi:hypothetical protein
MKTALKRQCFCDAADIVKRVTEGVTRFSRNGFQECFKHPYSHWQNCIAVQGDNFEGNVASMIILFCISQIKSDSGNILKLQRIKRRSIIKYQEMNIMIVYHFTLINRHTKCILTSNSHQLF